MKWILLSLLLAAPASAEPPWLVGQDYGTIPVEIKLGTVTVNTIVDPITVVIDSTTISTTGGAYGVISGGIAVSGGSGFAVFSATGTLHQCGIVAPSAVATYDFEIVTEDLDNVPILMRDGLTGSGSLRAPRIILGSHRIRFTNAIDGNYKVRCGLRE